jgi:endonuclease I
MIYANHLYNLATSKPRISMAEIEAMCIDKAKQGEFDCWVFNPIANEDIKRLRMNGFKVEKHNNASYRIDWSNPTNF